MRVSDSMQSTGLLHALKRRPKEELVTILVSSFSIVFQDQNIAPSS